MRSPGRDYIDSEKNQMVAGYILWLELTGFTGSLNVSVKDNIQEVLGKK